MNDNFPWTWAAMLVIAFLSWVFNKIQEATAERRRAEELRRRKGQPERSGPPSVPPSPPRQSAPQPSGQDNRESPLRDLIDALGGPPQPVRTPPPLKRESTPPAPQKTTPRPAEPAKPKLTKAEQEALARLQSGAAGKRKTRKNAVENAAAWRQRLRSAEGLRQAIILKELLDKPVSLR
ncbi:MAG: hypothetical protein KDM63_16790 [Verrucomicrobiae bacterium]|nr:hypothetical protein [Verrucomicrobiae bacterium]